MNRFTQNLMISILSLITIIGLTSFIVFQIDEFDELIKSKNVECIEENGTLQPITSTGDFLGFYAELAFFGFPFPIHVVSFSTFSGGSANPQGPWQTFGYTISNQFSPTNTSTYNPQQKELVCLISDEQQLFEYEDFFMSANTLNISPGIATAPVFLNGTYYAIEIEDGGSATVPLYEADIVSFDYQTATFNSNLHLQYSAGPNTSEFAYNHMSSATNRIDELYFLCATNLVIVTSLDIFNPAYCWIDLVPNNTANNYYSFAGIEYKAPGELLAIRNHWVNGNNTATDLVQIDFDATTCSVNNISVLFDLTSNLIPFSNNLIVNLEYHSTTYDPCNQLYYISTRYSDDFDTRLIEIDIQNQTHAEQPLAYYLFGIEWKQKPCPCTADFSITQLDNCGKFQFSNTSTGSPPMTCQWNFNDPASGPNNTSVQCQEVHQFTGCGTYNVCLTVDAGGCVESKCQTVIVSDNNPPVALCKSNVVLSMGVNCLVSVSPLDIDDGSFDDCQVQTMQVSPSTFSQCGNFPITLTVTDGCDNTSTSNTILQVVDNILPVITCPQDVYLSTCNPSCQSQVFSLQWTSLTDNCGSQNVSYSITGSTNYSGNGNASGLIFNQGVSVITYTTTDLCGNSASCHFKVHLACSCTCPDNLVKNPGFDDGAVFGSMAFGGQSNDWLRTPNTYPSVNNHQCCDPFSILFNPSTYQGSSIYQLGINLLSGRYYKISLSARLFFTGAPTMNLRFNLKAAKTPIGSSFNPYTCINCENMGNTSLVSTTSWQVYTLPIWTPTQNWDILSINALSGGSNFASGNIDNICIQEISIYKCCENPEVFRENIKNVINIYSDPIEEETVVEVGNYIECNSIALIDWGDGSDTTGPFGTNIQLRHQYPDDKKYEIKVIAQELDSSEQVCFETIVSDSSQIIRYSTKYLATDNQSAYNPNSGITKWTHEFTSRDKGGRINVEVSKYNLETSLLKPINFPDPVIDIIDEAGDQVSTEAGEIISFLSDDAIAEKLELLSPAPAGYGWKGYQSNLLTPTSSGSSSDFPFTISFTWLNLPAGSQDSSGYMWISDNKDELYGEQILDGFGFFPPTALDTTTAIQPIRFLENIMLYPNPARDEVTIKWGDHIPGDVIVKIIDCSGRMLQKKNLGSDILQSTIDVSMLEEGLYFIKILKANTPVRVLKFVKAR